jgi:TATA-box binding protein (TBP) (component of TFIID and TFIIIB)
MFKAIQSLRTNQVRNDFNETTLLVVNHVITVHFGPNLAELLPRMIMQNLTFRLSTEHFPSLVVQLSEPKATLMVFVTGSAVLVGSRSMQEAIYVAQWIRNELEQFRRQFMPTLSPRSVVFGNLKTVNIVNSSWLPREQCPVNLGLYAAKHNCKEVIYNPKRFPGCKITFQLKVIVVLFEGGNFNIVGCKTQEIAIACATWLIQEMLPYKTTPRESSKNIVRQRVVEFRKAKDMVGGWSDSEDEDAADEVPAELPRGNRNAADDWPNLPAAAELPIELDLPKELNGADVLNIDDALNNLVY